MFRKANAKNQTSYPAKTGSSVRCGNLQNKPRCLRIQRETCLNLLCVEAKGYMKHA